MRFSLRFGWLALFLLLLLFFPAQVCYAHASLIQADPAPNSQLESSPSQIRLLFNERLEKEFAYLTVHDQRKQLITDQPVTFSIDQKEIHVALSSSLPEGRYTVSYQVISADGHPIRGSYLFAVGLGLASSEAAEPPGAESTWKIALLVIRMLYFVSLILLLGWVFWGRYFPFAQSERIKSRYLFWSLILQQAHLLGLLMLIITQIIELSYVGDIRVSTVDIYSSHFLYSWLLSVLLTLIGFFYLHRLKWFDLTWLLLMIFAKSINGHPVSFSPVPLSILSDMIHLLAASIWAGGLWWLTVLSRRDLLYLQPFLKRFSAAAFVSIVVLMVTGTLLTFTYTSDITLLLSSPWGQILLIKLSIVLIAVLLAGVFRFLLKNKSSHEVRKWLLLDASLMLLIVTIAAILTYVKPE